MKYIRNLSALLACFMALSLAACAPRTAGAPAGGVIDIPAPEETHAPAGSVPAVAPVPTAVVPPAGTDTPALSTLSPAEPQLQTAAPVQTQAPVQTEAPAKTEASVQTQAPATAQTPAPAATDGLPYYLYLEKGSFTLTIYEKGDDGAYSKVYKTYRVAHGGNKTPAGTFTLSDTRERWHEFPDGGFVQYATLYHKRLYVHSPLYGEENNGYMWPKYYDGELGIGKASTGGCLRMVTEAARFIYENCPEGTVLEIVNGSPRGTTSDEVPDRNGKRYDPTDVDAGN